MHVEVCSIQGSILAIFHLPKKSKLRGHSLADKIITPEEFVNHIDKPICTIEEILDFMIFARRTFHEERMVINAEAKTLLMTNFPYGVGAEVTDKIDRGKWTLVVQLTSKEEEAISPMLDELAEIIFVFDEIQNVTGV